MNLKHLGFSDFLENEEVVSASFRHPVSGTFLKMFFFAGFWGAIACGVHWYWANYYYDYSSNNEYNLLWLIPAIIGCIKVFDVFMKWYANAILMTNESLIFAEFRHIFDRSISRIDYWDLDDVELEKKGVSDYLGNKGDLIFSKVSGGAAIEFKRVGNPRKIIKKIRKHKVKILNEKNFTEEGALKDLLSQLVQTHVRGKGQPEEKREFHEEIKKKVKSIKEKDYDELDFAKMKEEELAKLKKFYSDENNEEVLEDIDDEKNIFSIHSIKKFAKKIKKKHFHNELGDDNFEERENIEVEKELDDEGGLEIDLD